MREKCMILIFEIVHGRRFVRGIWTVMLVKEMHCSSELWQETSPGCTIMNQSVRDNRCSGNTRRLRPKKILRRRLPLGKSCCPSFGMSMTLYWCTPRKRINTGRYSDTLVNELKPAMWSKRRRLLSKSVLLLYDNARAHTAAHAVDKLRALKLEVLKHPPYSPELAPSDLWKNTCGATNLQMTTI